MNRTRARMPTSWVFALMLTVPAFGQAPHPPDRPLAANVIVPQARGFGAIAPGTVQVTQVEVGVVIVAQVATTTMDISLHNRSGRRQQAELVVPVPQGAVVRTFTFQGAASEATAQLLQKTEAQRTYEAIVAKARDPALLEFVGCNVIRSSVFPVDAGGTQKVRLTYEHVLGGDGSRIDYVLPRSESLDYNLPWSVAVKIKAQKPVSTVYSPSHKIEIKRADERTVSVRIADDAAREPGPFRLSYLLEAGAVTASLLAYPAPEAGGGYFLLLAGLPAEVPHEADASAIKREITLVIDRSGSMQGEKIEQVRAAALQILAGLEKGEAVRIIAYNDAVQPLSGQALPNTPENLAKARAFIQDLKAHGGTNIHDALIEALRHEPAEGMLPIVLFLTDGLPTVGQTSEVAIREVATKANPHERRIFTFGVGVDVNTPLLEKIAYETRATPTFVLPKEDVEVKVAQVFQKLSGPVLAGPTIEAVDDAGQPASSRASDLVPAKLSDLFKGDQLILLGRYRGHEPITFRLTGNYLGRPRTFRFTFDLDKATTGNAFVPRLWASRRIAVLVDAIRQAGADLRGPAALASAASDPRTRELIDEIVRLSTQFGILTEYTAFLAREGTDLSRPDLVMREAGKNFTDRAMASRSGMGSVNQSLNVAAQMQQAQVNTRNAHFDSAMNRVEIANVQQVADRAFYNRGGRWIDSRVVAKAGPLAPDRVVQVGSEDFDRLVEALSKEGRQGTLALKGEILLEVDGQKVLVKAPENR